jgi:diguanylate cyclase (GGDEF)-like protein
VSQSPALLLTACFAISAALLWLVAELAVAAGAKPRPVARALFAVSVVLGACALWWPSNALRVPAAVPAQGLHWLWPWLPCLALAGLAGVAGALWNLGQRAVAGLTAVGLPIAAYVHAMLSAPGIFRDSGAPEWLGVGSLTMALSLGLLLAQLSLPDLRIARALRAAGAMLAAAVACIGVAISVPASDARSWVAGPEWLVMIGLAALVAVLLMVLRQTTATETRGRPARAAAVDNLTGLPTRLHFEGRLQAAAKKCDAGSTQLAVLFIDLDGFKPVNDTFGHSSGDRVLEQVGQRLKTFARGAGVVARVGGDEFLLLATGTGQDSVARLATRLIDALSQPYKLDDREVAISCSVGIAGYPDQCHPNKLIARADAAMYAAKRAGGARHCFYAPEMDVDVQQNFDMLRDLRQALANDELELFFQPKIDARSGKITAAEALLRWNHPSRGMVMPNTFIPLAERSGLIGPLGNWVIEAACKQARAWRDKGLRMRVAINLSAYQMRQDDIADRIAEALARHRIQPALLTCEITETAAMEDTGATQETFRRLGELGTHLSIDDFGTGYSSLSYLRQLPAEELKIDASFVKDVDTSADARAVIDAVVKLAHALGLKVVAEGVETLRQHKILVELGCDELQGYLFAKPMTARALLLWAMDDRSTSAVFRDSLFGETRQASRQGALRQG